MNAVRLNNVSLKYQRFTSSGYKVIGFTKIEFVAKSQFLWWSKGWIWGCKYKTFSDGVSTKSRDNKI